MDPFPLIIILILIQAALLAALAALLWPRGQHQGAPESLQAQPAHVHEYLQTSTEQTAGRSIAVFQCTTCGATERREQVLH